MCLYTSKGGWKEQPRRVDLSSLDDEKCIFSPQNIFPNGLMFSIVWVERFLRCRHNFWLFSRVTVFLVDQFNGLSSVVLVNNLGCSK